MKSNKIRWRRLEKLIVYRDGNIYFKDFLPNFQNEENVDYNKIADLANPSKEKYWLASDEKKAPYVYRDFEIDTARFKNLEKMKKNMYLPDNIKEQIGRYNKWVDRRRARAKIFRP